MNDQEGPALIAQTKVEEAQAALSQATALRESIRAYPFLPRSLQQRRLAIITEEQAVLAVKAAEQALHSLERTM